MCAHLNDFDNDTRALLGWVLYSASLLPQLKLGKQVYVYLCV